MEKEREENRTLGGESVVVLCCFECFMLISLFSFCMSRCQPLGRLRNLVDSGLS